MSMTMMLLSYRRSIFLLTLIVGILSSEIRVAFASCQGGIAQDDPTFKYTTKSGVERSCKNISQNPKRNRRMCRLSEVHSHCMLTCGGSCCMDDANFEFPMNWKNKQQRCEFISKNIKQVEKRRQAYCKDRAKIRNKCPYACGLTCDETGKPVLGPTPSSPTPPPNYPHIQHTKKNTHPPIHQPTKQQVLLENYTMCETWSLQV